MLDVEVAAVTDAPHDDCEERGESGHNDGLALNEPQVIVPRQHSVTIMPLLPNGTFFSVLWRTTSSGAMATRRRRKFWEVERANPQPRKDLEGGGCRCRWQPPSSTA